MSTDFDYEYAFERFIETLKEVNACPYCGTIKAKGSPCCGEVHDSPMWDNGDSYLSESELKAAFQDWIESREQAPHSYTEEEPRD